MEKKKVTFNSVDTEKEKDILLKELENLFKNSIVEVKFTEIKNSEVYKSIGFKLFVQKDIFLHEEYQSISVSNFCEKSIKGVGNKHGLNTTFNNTYNTFWYNIHSEGSINKAKKLKEEYHKQIADPNLRKYGSSQYPMIENTANCVEAIHKNFHDYQCSKKRGHGKDKLYCKQHAKLHPN